MSEDDIAEAIRSAGARSGWDIRPQEPGVLEGTRRWHGRHRAVVRITHDRHSLTIRLVRSDNLLQEGNRVHVAYNDWVRKLERDVLEAINGARERL